MTRWAPPAQKRPKLPDGRAACKRCGGPVEPPKRAWCSQRCVDEYLVRRSGADARRLLLRRDKGICAHCGRDCVALARELKHLRWKVSYAAWKDRMTALVAEGFHLNRKTYWDADHIVEVVRGGGACGLENLQTLCVPCHKRKTAALARQRAKARAEYSGPTTSLSGSTNRTQ